MPDSKFLIKIMPDARLIKGAIPLSNDDYATLIGAEFVRVAVKGREYAILAGKFGDISDYDFGKAPNDNENKNVTSLLGDYHTAMFQEVNRRFDGFDRAMGIYLGSEQKEATMRAWLRNGFSFLFLADGRHSLKSRITLVGFHDILQTETLEEKVKDQIFQKT